jgi:hypothetical protein
MTPGTAILFPARGSASLNRLRAGNRIAVPSWLSGDTDEWHILKQKVNSERNGCDTHGDWHPILAAQP